MRDLSRLFRPASIAVVGGGAWCRAVLEQCRKMGFAGQLWPVHPTAQDIAGYRVYAEVSALPAAPDAVFVGVNRKLTVGIVGHGGDCRDLCQVCRRGMRCG
jgi:acyl-CoA synthetase (NDP forming)